MGKIKVYPKPKKPRSKFVTITIMILFGLAIGAAGYVVYKQYFAPDAPEKITTTKNTPKPQTTASTLDGTQTSKELANRHPLAVIIENHTQARPQVGLDKASIVYEAISEGGITRFMAIYGSQDASKVGPVRSARTYFLDWNAEYNGFLAHVGGNIDALDRISQEGVLDLDEFGLGTKAYWREPEAGKAIEHTMFSSTEKLYAAAKEKKWDMNGSFKSLKFLNPKKIEKNPNTLQEITIDFSSPQYKVKYTYDPAKNVYLREMNGLPHRDSATGNQLAPTNIIIQSVPRAEAITRINEQGWKMDTIGEGKAYIFYNGQRFDASWKKTDLKSRTLFYDSSGQEISFLPGQFWYEIVPPDVFDKIDIKTETSTPQPTQS